MPYTPAQVAKLIGISAQAVRDWSSQYAPLLSPQARGENGPRLFSEDDLNAMRTIANLRQTKLRADEIIQRMQDGDVPPIVDVEPTETLKEPTESPQTPQDAPLALNIAYTSLQGHIQATDKRIDTTDKRVDAVERALALMEQRQGESANKFVTGAIIGGGVVLVFVALVLALTR